MPGSDMTTAKRWSFRALNVGIRRCQTASRIFKVPIIGVATFQFQCRPLFAEADIPSAESSVRPWKRRYMAVDISYLSVITSNYIIVAIFKMANNWRKLRPSTQKLRIVRQGKFINRLRQKTGIDDKTVTSPGRSFQRQRAAVANLWPSVVDSQHGSQGIWSLDGRLDKSVSCRSEQTCRCISASRASEFAPAPVGGRDQRANSGNVVGATKALQTTFALS